MTAQSMTFTDTLDSTQKSVDSRAFLASLVHYLAGLRAGFQQRAQARSLCRELESMDNRLLLDIGLDEGDIARLRAGERFIPIMLQS